MEHRDSVSGNLPAWVAGASAAAVVIGALGPWIRGTAVVWGTLTRNGTDNLDGRVILGMGLAAGVLMAIPIGGSSLGVFPILAAMLFVTIVLLGIADYRELQRLSDRADAENVIASIRWGIYLVLIGGSVGAGSAIYHYVRDPRHARAPIVLRPEPELTLEEIDDRALDRLDKAGVIALCVLVAWLLISVASIKLL